MAVARLTTVEKALRVLSAVAEQQPISGSALARDLELDKNAVQRILITLGHQGWLQQDRRAGGWRLGPQSLVVGGRYAGALRDRAHPGTARPGRRDQRDDHAVGGGGRRVHRRRRASRARRPLRGTIPIGYTASVTEGRDFLAFYDRVDARAAAGTAGLPPMSDEHARAVRDARLLRRGHEYTSTIAVGAPVWDSRPTPAAALLLIAPEGRMASERLTDMGCGCARPLPSSRRRATSSGSVVRDSSPVLS